MAPLTPRVLHTPGPLDKESLTYPCACGGRWHMGSWAPYHVDPFQGSFVAWAAIEEALDVEERSDVPAFGVYSGQGDEA